ncbi:MAG: aspartate--tRNA(Asn) ligase [Treponema sp.]|jgi:nondiscriminating aspartyl-tRNA synthetase|nr:aspartate--tRNA(Asn) ligase [Treponema sp.]
MRILARDIAGYIGTEIVLNGWVHRIRALGGISFIILRDRSGFVQLVMNEAPHITLESVIKVSGIPTANEKAPGKVELLVRSWECISSALPDLPYHVNGRITKQNLETILEQRVLSLRNPQINAIFKVQATVIEAFSAYLRSQDFTEIKTSKIVSSGTEGGTELFEVEYFGKKAYLAQSPQFYKEVLVASGLERVFEVAPVFRAEKHDTPRHLNEYISLDVEMAFIESEKALIELEKQVLAHIFESVAQKHPHELTLWNAAVPDSESVFKSPIISYQEALNIAAEAKQSRFFDITPEVERLVCEWSVKEKGTALVFINEFPSRLRPFYTYPLDGSLTMSFDAIFRGLEITTGGRRHHNVHAFIESLEKFGLKAEQMAHYLSVLNYGCPPHGGFALGCERLTARILGLTSVKEASLFPRDRKRTTP